MAYGYQGASRHHCQMASTPSDLYLTPNYRFTLRISKDFSHAQRSGHLPFNQCVKWHGHSGLTDGLDQGVDLVGGYYDAGDHVKFGLPMAFTITLLSWSVTEYEKDIKAINEFEHALEAIKWGLITLLKLIHVLWVQVGDGSSDHYCWQRPEDMTTRRRSFKIDKNNPGSEVAAETAAALASTSIAFNILIYEST